MSGLIVDLFAGGGGASVGLAAALGREPDVAVNHDEIAITVHRKNHPETKHYVKDIFEVPPLEATGGKPVDILWASPDCFPAGTLVLTRTGYRPIEEVCVGDQVLTHKLRWRRVQHVFETRKELLSLKGYGHPDLRVSAEHPFLARKGLEGDSTWKKAADLGTGDLWATPASFPEEGVPDVGGRGMPIDERLMWLAGRYLADGWTRFTDHRAELVICVGKAKRQLASEKLNQWPREGSRAQHGELAWWERETPTEFQFSTNHRGLVAWLREHFGHLAHNKRIPVWALGMPERMRCALMEGYLSGDGHFVRGRGEWQSTTSSKALCFGLKALASSLGENVRVYLRKENCDVIEGRKVTALPSWHVRWTDDTVANRDVVVHEGGFAWSPFGRAEQVDGGLVPTYNLSVEEDESYIVESIVVHNCTHHSRAKGDVPRDQKIRALADVIIPWARLTKPRFIFVENVPEFEGWGPLNSHGRPDKSKKGHLFQGWVNALRQLGYNVEWRVLNCSEYGAPTKRMRLFVVARRDGLPVAWPEKTHGPGRPNELVPAWRCIDWSLPCPSIFMTPEEVKEQGLRIRRPLAEKTMARIANGVRRYVLEAKEPFLIRTGHWNATTGEGSQFRGQGLTDPLATVCATNDKALIRPVVTKVNHGRDEDRSQDIEDQLTTVCAQRRGHAVVQATIEPVDTSEITPCPDGDGRWHVPNGYCVDDKGLGAYFENELREEGLKEEEIVELLAPALMKFRGDSAGKPVDEPVPTITGGGNTSRPAGHAHAMGLMAASLVRQNSGNPPTSVEDPTHTITTQENRHTLVSAFLAKHYGGVTGHDLKRPVGTVTAKDHHALAAASLVKFRGTSSGHMGQPDIRESMDTISAGGNHMAEVRAFLTKYHGCPQEIGQSLFDSMHTITGSDRFGLVTIQGEEYQIIDIGMRMLQPHELLAAQFGEFAATYSFDVTKKNRFGNDVPLGHGDKVRLIGNSVPPHVVRALVTANCDDIVAKEKAA